MSSLKCGKVCSGYSFEEHSGCRLGEQLDRGGEWTADQECGELSAAAEYPKVIGVFSENCSASCECVCGADGGGGDAFVWADLACAL